MLAKMARKGAASSPYRKTGKRQLNKAGGDNARTGQAFEDVVRADGLKGHLYDGGEVVWLDAPKALKPGAGALASSARADVQQQAAPARTSSSFLQELLEATKRKPSRFRQL